MFGGLRKELEEIKKFPNLGIGGWEETEQQNELQRVQGVDGGGAA